MQEIRNLVSLMERRHRGAGLFHHADSLVAENPTFRHTGKVAFKDMEIRPANGRSRDADDGVGCAP